MDFFDRVIAKKIYGGSGGGSGGGGGFATGTMTLADAQTVTTPETRVTHNLGYIPNNLLWFIEDTTSKDTSNLLIGKYKMGFEYITPSLMVCAYAWSSSTTSNKDMRYELKSSTEAAYTFTNAKATETDIGIFFVGSYRVAGTIPAGSTIRWLVW